jgi:DNA-binding LacI/PurR family transcriptional regulator
MAKKSGIQERATTRARGRRINPQAHGMRMPLTDQVVVHIRSWLAEEQVLPGHFIPSERALSEMFGVSRVTVRRALRILIKDQTLSSVACRGYSLSPFAVRENGETPRTPILFIHAVPPVANVPMERRHQRIWAGVREEAVKHGLLAMVCWIAEEALTASCVLELARITKTVLCDYTCEKSLRALLDAGIHVVKLQYYRNSDLPIDAIVQDDVGGMEAAVRHLFCRGHRRIGYVDAADLFRSERRELNMMHRLSGFKTCTRQLGIADTCVVLPYSEEDAAALTRRFLDMGVTALIFPYVRSWHAMRPELERNGILIPSDFGVVIWQAESLPDDPWHLPDHVAWSREEMGREAVRRLLLRLKENNAEPTTIMIPCQVIDAGTGGKA